MSDTANICQMEDPATRLGFLRARQQELMAELAECNTAIDATMAALRYEGRSVVDIAALAGLSRQEANRRIKRRSR